MFAFFRKSAAQKQAGERLYRAIVDQSRAPVFYEFYGVPDTVDGRFDLICLHAFLVVDRLQAGGEAGKKLSQAVFDAMFVDMDRVLREMGVGDLGIPKHVKRMMKGFNGRATAYQAALRANDQDGLAAAVRKNLYGSASAPAQDHVRAIVGYMQDIAASLAAQPYEALADGVITFRDPQHDKSENERNVATGMAA